MSLLRSLAQPVLRRAKVFPIDQVSSINPAEITARDLGLSQHVVDEVWKGMISCYKEGLHPGLAICIRYKGEVIFDRALGHSHGNGPDGPDGELVPATHESLFSLFSASKSVSAMVIHHLDQENKLRVNDRVVEYLPDFGRHGKGQITIAQLLCHKAGVAALPKEFANLDYLQDEGKVNELMNSMTLQSTPGRRLAYHALTAGFAFNAICKKVTGLDMRQYLAKHILDPLGFSYMNFGVEADDASKVAKHYYTGEKDFFPFSQIIERSLSLPFADVIDVSNDPRYHTSIIPSGNVVSSANEASRFFQLLLNGGELDGKRIFDPATIERALVEQTYGVPDAMLMMPVIYSQGFMLGSRVGNLFGGNTHKAFGHLGFTNTVVWADRERDISVAFLNNGKPFITLGAIKSMRLPRLISRLFAR